MLIKLLIGEKMGKQNVWNELPLLSIFPIQVKKESNTIKYPLLNKNDINSYKFYK